MAREDRDTGARADMAFGTSAIADTTAPTVAEITALTRIECGLITGTLDTPRTGSTTDISANCERETFNVAATIENGNITGTFYREFDGTDEFWALFDDQTVPPPTAYLVIARGGFTGGTPTAGDDVDVYTCNVVSRSPMAPNKSEAQRFMATLSTVSVDYDGTVAA